MDGEEEFEVEEIVRACMREGARQVLVKWTGYTKLTWELLEALHGTMALQQYEAAYGPADKTNGPQPRKGKRGVL